MKRRKHVDLKKKALQNRAVRAEYDALEEEFALVAELIRARKKHGKSQKEVAIAMHTSASAVSRLEAGSERVRHAPSLSTLRRYAHALECRLFIKLVPK